MSSPLTEPFVEPTPSVQSEPRRGRRLPVRTIGAVSASVLAFPLVAGSAQAATIPYPKPAKPLPSALDVAAPYQKGTQCLTYNQPGAVAFAKLLNETYGNRTYGILRTCAAEHGEGRALDWMINANNSDQLALANALTRWLAAPDAQGRPGAMAKRFGINYIIWNRQQWRAYDPGRGWAPYYGVSPHTDHIHFSFNWDGARMRSSWWSGVAVTDPLTNASYTPALPITPPPAPVMTASGYPLLAQGATGPEVTLAQKVIDVTADGKFGPVTATALGTWQTKNKLSATKKLDNATWSKMVALKLIPSRTVHPLQQYVNVVLKRGSSGAAVKALQKALGGLTVDGSFGPATETKVKAYQKAKGLTVNGVVDSKVWNALIKGSTATAPAPTAHPLQQYVNVVLKRGSSGAAVKALQKALGGLTVDGSFGPATETKVKAYQRAKGLTVNGVVDSKVWNALIKGSTATAPAPTVHPLAKYAGLTLKLWSKGEAVTAMQKAIGKLTADGSFGRLTEARVKEYQTEKKLPVTGVVDAAVWKALMGTTTTTTAPAPSGSTITSLATAYTPYKGTVLKVGSSGAAVKVLQRGLGGLVVDGSFGSLTLTAVKRFQTAKGLTVTGVVDAKTWAALELTTHPLLPYWGTVVKRGSTGATVVALQKALRITADGSFGPVTEAAVKSAQAGAKLSQTGVVGTLTWKAIEARMPR